MIFLSFVIIIRYYDPMLNSLAHLIPPRPHTPTPTPARSLSGAMAHINCLGCNFWGLKNNPSRSDGFKPTLEVVSYRETFQTHASHNLVYFQVNPNASLFSPSTYCMLGTWVCEFEFGCSKEEKNAKLFLKWGCHTFLMNPITLTLHFLFSLSDHTFNQSNPFTVTP